MNKHCFRIPGAWHGSHLPWGSLCSRSGKTKSTQTTSPTQQRCFNWGSNRQLGLYFMRSDGNTPIQGAGNCCVQKQRCLWHIQKVNVVRREVFFDSDLLNPLEWAVSLLRKVVHLCTWRSGSLCSPSFSALWRLNHQLAETEQPTRAVRRAGICLEIFFWLYHPQLVLPQLWLLYGGGILKVKKLVRNVTA